MNSTTFATINKLGSGLKKKSKKKKGKPGKVNETVCALVLLSQQSPLDYLYTGQKLKSPQLLPSGSYNFLTPLPGGWHAYPHGFNATIFPRGRKLNGLSFQGEIGEIRSLCVAKKHYFEERDTE